MLYLTKKAAEDAKKAAWDTMDTVRKGVLARGATATFEAAESEKFTKAETDFDAADLDIKAHEKHDERTRVMALPVNRLPAGEGQGETKGRTTGEGEGDEDSEKDWSYLDTKSVEFKFRFSKKAIERAFVKNIRGSQLDEAETKAYAKFHARQQALQRKFSSTQDRDGGLATPPEVRTEVIMRIRDMTWVRQLATVITTQRESVILPTLEPGTNTTTRVGEKTTVSVTDLTNMLGRQRMIPSKRLAIVKAPRELLEDEDFPLVDRIIAMYATWTAEEEEAQFLTGTGNGEPLGIYTALVGTSSAVDIAGSTPALVAEDLYDAIYTLKAQYRKRASWTLHRKVIKAIRKMRDDSGASAGTGQFLWQPGLQAGQPDIIAGYAVRESEYVPDPYTGADGDPMLLFGDWSTYYICDRTNLEIVRDDSKYRDTDEVGYFIRRRYDGMPTLASPWVRTNRK